MAVKEDAPLLPTTGPQDETPVVHGQPAPASVLGMVYVAASGLSFSLVTACVKYATYSMTAMEAVFWRSLSGFVFNYASVLLSKQNLSIEPEQRKMLLNRCFSGFFSTSLGFYAIAQMDMADANAIKFTSPILTYFFGACMLHERIEAISLACACFSFAGLIFVVRPGFLFGYTDASAAGSGSWLAVGAAMLAALAHTMVFITVRQLKGVDVLVVVHYFLLFSIFTSLLFIGIFEPYSFVVPATPTLWAVIVACGANTFLGQFFLTKGLQLEKAGVASTMRYLDVVFVFIWDAALLDETISGWSVIGALIICLGAVVIALRKARETRS